MNAPTKTRRKLARGITPDDFLKLSPEAQDAYLAKMRTVVDKAADADKSHYLAHIATLGALRMFR